MKIKEIVLYKSKLTGARRPFSNYTIVFIIALAVIGSTLFFFIGSHESDSNSQTYSIIFAQATKEIIPSVDMILSLGDTTLYVPRGATNRAGYLSITAREPELSLPGKLRWTRPIVVNIQYLNYQGTPVPGISFFKPVQVCFKINEEQWRDYTKRPAAYQVEYYKEGLVFPRWVALPMNTDPERLQLCGETDHLSLFALAIKIEEEMALPVIPITGASPTPTSTSTIFPTAIGTNHQTSTPKNSGGGAVAATPVSTQAALTATSVALTATATPDIPPTDTDEPTATYVPPTDTAESTATYIPPTATDDPPPTPEDTPVVEPTNPPNPTDEPPPPTDPPEGPTEPPT